MGRGLENPPPLLGLRNSILHDILQFLNLQDGKKRLLSVNQFDPIPAFFLGGGAIICIQISYFILILPNICHIWTSNMELRGSVF